MEACKPEKKSMGDMQGGKEQKETAAEVLQSKPSKPPKPIKSNRASHLDPNRQETMQEQNLLTQTGCSFMAVMKAPPAVHAQEEM